MNETILETYIRHEGFELDPYLDTKKLKTGGIGHLMSDKDIKEFNYNWSEDKKTEYWIDKFEEDYAKAKSSALDDFGHLGLNPEQLELITELKFNMGTKGFTPKNWPSFTKALEAKDLEKASYELLHNSSGGPSDWLKDVKGRATEMAEKLRNSNGYNKQ